MFADNLKKARINSGLSQEQVAKKIFKSQQAYAKYELGKSSPDPDTITELAKILNVSIQFLLDKEITPESRKGVKIPVYGRVAAGIPIDAIEDIIDYEEITEEEARKGEYFALKIKGRSMEPRIYSGDVVIVRQQPDVDNGDIAIVLINGEEATCKKIKKTPEGVLLISLNPNYEPMFYTNKQIEDLPVIILGKVVELRGKF